MSGRIPGGTMPAEGGPHIKGRGGMPGMGTTIPMGTIIGTGPKGPIAGLMTGTMGGPIIGSITGGGIGGGTGPQNMPPPGLLTGGPG
jgi:hypothetical protein